MSACIPARSHQFIMRGRGFLAQTDIKGRGRRLPTIAVVGSSAHTSSSSPPGGFEDYYIQAIKTKTINGSVTAYVLYLKPKG